MSQVLIVWGQGDVTGSGVCWVQSVVHVECGLIVGWVSCVLGVTGSVHTAG